MKPTGDGTGGDLVHIWLLPPEEQVDEQPADMVVAARASDARQEEKRMLDMSVSLLAE